MPVKRYNGDDAGAVAIIVAVCSVVFLLLAALVVDLGLAMEQRRDAQKAVDLAALAGGQELPDGSAAVDVAAAYLIDNGWGTDASGAAISKATLITQLTDGDTSNGEAVITSNTRLELTAPDRTVDFSFAPVGAVLGGDGASAATISARAVVEIRSLGGILPYQIPGGSTFGVQCLKSDSGKPGVECREKTTGNFGWLDLPRNPAGSSTGRVELNIRDGAQFIPSLIPNAETVLTDALNSPAGEIPCTATTPPGAILANYTLPADGYNCVDVEAGAFSNALREGLIGLSGKPTLRCKGRLVLPAPTLTSLKIGTCNISEDRFADYTTTATPDPANYMSWGPISADIVDDPRFGMAPVVASKELSGVSNQYPIVRFYGVYYKDLYDQALNVVTSGDGKQIQSVSAYVFPLSFIDGIRPNEGGTIEYIGGPKVPVLIE